MQTSQSKFKGLKIILTSNTLEFLLNYKYALTKSFIELGSDVYFAVPKLKSQLSNSDIDKSINLIDLGNYRKGFKALICIFYNYIKIFKDKEKKIILSHTAYCNILAVLAFKISNKSRNNNTLYVFISGFGPSRIRNSIRYRLLGRIYLFSMRLASNTKNIKIVTLNKDDRYLIQDFITKRNVILWREAGLSIKDINYEPKIEANIFKDSLKVGFFGRFLLEKGFNDFIDLKILSKKLGYNFEFLIGGSEDQESSSSVSLKDLDDDKLNNIKIFIRPNYSEFFKKIDILVFPSYREGHPLYLFRAMAYGVVPIVYPNPGNTVDIIDGYNGLLSKINTSEGLLAQLADINLNREKLIQMKKNARNYSRLFTEEESNSTLIKIIGCYL